MHYRILTASKSAGISSGLTYESAANLAAGQHVIVPLRGKTTDGIVLAKDESFSAEYDVKPVEKSVGQKPLLTDAQIATLEWMSEYYCCSPRQALRVWLPTPPWHRLQPEPTTLYHLVDTNFVAKGAKQQVILDLLAEQGSMSWAHIREQASVSLASLRSLVSKNIVEESVSMPSVNEHPPKQVLSRPTLTSAQQDVYEHILSSVKPALLFGVTGSGKTEVYAQLIADAVESGKQAILLLPEILLTENFVERFEGLLDKSTIAVLHSRLTDSQRRAQWQRVHRNEVSLVIGSRSALFAPAQHLGLIIIDEEHEWTYKNEQTPRYHTRETAQKLCQLSGAKLVLGSATPSLESWHAAKQGTFLLTRLPHRYKNAPVPDVRVIDLASANCGDHYPLSPPLLGAIADRLAKGEQSILFLNRRGMASALLCLECRRRIVSPESNLPFTLHQAGNKPYLQDHTTGTTAEVPERCPHCQSTELHAVGSGTQGVEKSLESLFPNARILRADKDTLDHPEKIRLLLKKMKEGQADILLGTQSVVKGLDLPGVTLSAVVLADIGLSLPHFRAGERIFQLLTQLTGRSGRHQPGEVFIQTYRPDATEVEAAATHDTETYLENELRLRKHFQYPPEAELVRLLLRGPHAAEQAKQLASAIQAAASNEIAISYSPTLFGGGRIWHILVRGPKAKRLVMTIDTQEAIIDVDPIDVL